MEDCTLDPTLVKSLIFSLSSTVFWVFTEDLGQGHDNTVKWPEPNSVKDY